MRPALLTLLTWTVFNAGHIYQPPLETKRKSAHVLQDAQPDEADLLGHRDASQHSHASHTAQHDISNPGLQRLWEEAQAVMQDDLLPTNQMLSANSTQSDAQSQMEATSALQAQPDVAVEPECASCMLIQVIALAATGRSEVCCTCVST